MSYPAGTMVLTPDGWKTIEQVKHTDKVAECHDGELVFSNPVDTSSRVYTGNLVNVDARNYGFITTPDHVHTLAENRYDRSRKATSAELHTLRHHYVRVAAPLARRDREVHDPDFARMVGMMRSNMLLFLRTHILVRVQLSTIRPYMIALMDKIGISYTQKDARFEVARHPRLMAYFNENGFLRRSTLLQLDQESLKLFIQGTINWRGRTRPPAHPTEITRLPRKETALMLELCARAGMSACERVVDDRWLHVKVRPERENLLPLKTGVIDYSGRVYDLATPTGTLFTRTAHKQALTTDGTLTL